MRLLPPNASNLELALEQAVQTPALPVPLRKLWSVDDCPVQYLPWLARSVSIDNWSPQWPEAVKRQRIRTAYYVQRRKGTVASVRAVVGALGASVAIREWWQTTPQGVPHTFEVVININSTGAVPADYLDSVIEEISRTKPLRSHFTITQGLQANGGVGVKAVARPMLSARIAAEAA